MRNFFKRSERANRSRRPNRGVSAVAASLASAALVAGLASYPVGAQDGVVPVTTSAVESEVSPVAPSASTVSETMTSTATSTVVSQTPTSLVPTTSPKASPLEPVQVKRSGDVDTITIIDPVGEVWRYGAKASAEDIFGITRTGTGEIKEILKVTIDGEVLDPQYYGFVNDNLGGVLAFDLDALVEIPPRHVELQVRTTEAATYAVAESEEVPTAKDLTTQSTYGKTDAAAATVKPDGVGMVRAGGTPVITATSAGLKLSNVTTTGNNPYLTSVSVSGASTFNSAVVRIAASKSILSSENYRFTIDGIEVGDSNGYGIGHTVRNRSADAVEIEFFPTQYGKRIASVPLADGATFHLASQFGTYAVPSGSITINGEPRAATSQSAVPAASGPMSGEYKLPLGSAALSTGTGDAQSKQLTAELLGTKTQRDVQPTKVRITYNGIVNENTASLAGPVTFRKQDGQTCVVQNPRPVETQRLSRGGSVVTALEADLTSCGIKFWEGNKDKISVEFNGPGGPTGSTGTYSLEVWGRQDQANNAQPLPNSPGGSPIDANKKCVSDDPETILQPRLGKRDVTDAERQRGTEIYISTSAAANGQNKNRPAMTHTLLSIQEQGTSAFVGIGSSNWIYNGLAYNEQDNWLYAISQHRGEGIEEDPCYPSGHLLQIDPTTGAVRDLGEVKNGTGNAFKSGWWDRGSNGVVYFHEEDRKLINTGFFYDSDLYVSNSAISGTRTLYKVSLPAVGETMPKGIPTRLKGFSEDYAVVSSAPQYAWGLVSASAYKDLGYGYTDSNGKWVDSNSVYVERIDLANGRVDRWALNPFEARSNMGESLVKKATWGKAWTYGNGSLGFAQGGNSANDANPGVQLQVTDPGSRRPSFKVLGLLNKVPESYNTDAASNAMKQPPSQSDLELEKVAISQTDGRTYPGFDKSQMQQGRTYWAIRLKNLGPDSSPGAIVTDVVPKSYEDVQLISEYVTQSDGYQTLVQLSPNTRSPRADGLFATGPTDFQYIIGALHQNDEVWMYISAALRRNAECVPNEASVSNNDLDPDPTNNADQSACPAIVEIHKKFSEKPAADGSHLKKQPDGTYQVKYQVSVTNMKSTEVYYEPPIDEIFVPIGFKLANAQVKYTNEWKTKSITCVIDGDNGYLTPSAFTPGKATRFRLQDCRNENSPYLGFDGRLFEGPSETEARKHRHIDAAKVSGNKVVTGTHTYDIEANFTVDENVYVAAYPSVTEGGACDAVTGGLVNTAYLGNTPSEQPCTTPKLDRPLLHVVKEDNVTKENLSDLGVTFAVHADNSGQVGPAVAQLTSSGSGLETDKRLEYNKWYWLQETKAPNGYSLLVEPIRFQIKPGTSPVIEFDKDYISASKRDGQAGVAIMAVANVRQGDLPKTGGVGLQLPVLIGGTLIAVGAVFGRKRTAA